MREATAMKLCTTTKSGPGSTLDRIQFLEVIAWAPPFLACHWGCSNLLRLPPSLPVSSSIIQPRQLPWAAPWLLSFWHLDLVFKGYVIRLKPSDSPLSQFGSLIPLQKSLHGSTYSRVWLCNWEVCPHWRLRIWEGPVLEFRLPWMNN